MSSGSPHEKTGSGADGQSPLKSYDLPSWTGRLQLVRHLRSTVEATVRAIDIEREKRGSLRSARQEPPKRGRRLNARALGVAQMCLGSYETLTGPVPTSRVGRKKNDPRPQPVALYIAFLTDVFDAIGIEQNAEHYGRRALKERRQART